MTLAVDEALWRPGDRWIVEGNLTKADGTPDIGGFVIAQLVKADGTRIEIGRATVDIVPVPGFDIANRPISPASLDDVSEANDHVEVFAISSDGQQTFTSSIAINSPPAPIPHVGTQVVIEAVEIIINDRLIIHGYASLDGGPAAGTAVITTDVSNQEFQVALDPAPGPLAGAFDFVARPIEGNGGFIQGETLTVTVAGVGFATTMIDLAPDAVVVPAVTAPAVVDALETTTDGTVGTTDPAPVDVPAVEVVAPAPVAPPEEVAPQETTFSFQEAADNRGRIRVEFDAPAGCTAQADADGISCRSRNGRPTQCRGRNLQPNQEVTFSCQ